MTLHHGGSRFHVHDIGKQTFQLAWLPQSIAMSVQRDLVGDHNIVISFVDVTKAVGFLRDISTWSKSYTFAGNQKYILVIFACHNSLKTTNAVKTLYDVGQLCLRSSSIILQHYKPNNNLQQ